MALFSDLQQLMTFCSGEAIRSVLGDVRIRSTFANYTHITDSGILSEVLADNAIAETPELIRAVKSHFIEALRAHICINGPFPEIPGAKKILRELSHSVDHSVAIATGGWRESAILKLDSAGLGDFEIPLATSDDARERKKIMCIALASLGSAFRSITYYGDGPWDRDESDELGWRFVAVGPALGGLSSYGVIVGA
jgi:hypothetical protein